MTNRKENCFDFLRLFAACCVVIAHSAGHLNLQFLWVKPGSSGLDSHWFRDGVPLFFVLSGFLVYRSYERCVERNHPLSHFLVNRWLRVAPAIYAYVIVAPALLLITSAISVTELASRAFLKFVVTHLLLLCSSGGAFRAFAPTGLNGSLWTIPVECSFYLVIPLFYLVHRKFGLKFLGILLVVLGSTGVAIKAGASPDGARTIGEKLILSTFLPYMIFFGLGILASKLWAAIPKSRGLALICFTVYILVRTLNVLGLDTDPGQGLFIKGSMNPIFCFAWSVPMAYWVLWVAHYGPSSLSRFTQKIGDLSYGVYIWHMVVVQMAVYFALGDKLNAILPGATQVLVLASTLLLAKLSWIFVEKPSLGLKLYSSREANSA